MKKLGKVLTVLLPVVALFLESLPYGAVLVFKDFPDGTIRTTYSYFSPTPWGYANFPPGITALLTCVLLMAAILAAAKDSRKALLRVFGISLAAAVISPMQLLYNINNFSVTGCLITVTLAAECVLSGVLARRKQEKYRAGIIAMPAPCVIYLYFFRTASSSRSIRSSPSIRRAFSAYGSKLSRAQRAGR